MNITVFIILKSLLQGIYKGTIFSAAAWYLQSTYHCLSNPYFASEAISGFLQFNSKILYSMISSGSMLAKLFFIILAISIASCLINNTIKNKKY